MKRFLSKKVLIMAVLCSLTLTTVTCGYILYPECRDRHQTRGEFDVPVLVMDCLWLLVGVVPGVVALVVDFTTGCVYESGQAVKGKAGANLDLRLRGVAPAEADMEVTLRAPGGYATTLLLERFSKGEQKMGTMAVKLPAQLAPGYYDLAVSVNGVENATWPLEISE